LADLDGDGNDDVISGSYWPGDITWFRGLGDGKFAAGEILKDKEGKHVNAGPPWKNEKKPEMDSLAASPWLVDFDGDSDLDLLIGNIAGNVVLIENQGDRKQPAFVRKGRIECSGGEVNVGGDAGPTTADWDGDGRWDLVVGGDQGKVVWYRNVGKKTRPKFEAGVDLVSGGGHGSLEAGEEPKAPAARLKVHCTDWNGDGKLDLLVGDFASVQMPEPELTDAQKQRRKELQREQGQLSQKLSPLFQKQQESGKLSAEDQKQLEDLLQQNQKLWEELRPLQAAHKATGFVWVYLRKGNGRS
jgi:hypothetical protein